MGCALAAIVAASSGAGDYTIHGDVSGDNPGPAIDALIHGQLGTLAARQPLMGLTSIVLRAPFAALAAPLGGGRLLTYRLGAFACLLPAVLLTVWLVGSAGRSRRALFTASVGSLVLLAGPATRSALGSGHPEEVLASVLAVGAVVAASGGRPRIAGALVGLAIGTKQWAVIGLLPMFVALRSGHGRALGAAAATGVAASALMALDTGALTHAARLVGGTHLANQLSVWWPFGTGLGPIRGASGAVIARRLPLGLDRSQASILVVGILLSVGVVVLIGMRRRRWLGSLESLDPLVLLAALALARCVADPAPLAYYFVPLFAALATWEARTADGLPVVTLLATGLVAAEFGPGLKLEPAAINALALAGAALLALHLAQAAVVGCRCDPGGLRAQHVPLRLGVRWSRTPRS